MHVLTIFALIFHRIGFMALIFLTTGNTNIYPILNQCRQFIVPKLRMSMDEKVNIWGGGCKQTGYVGLGGGGGEKIL